ncbi:BirA family biotin operon repressor/biotin-[acetyl-CoA-carboxylase] ligase [Microvirga flocculans]|uniref:biotin--[biotin carboxyl-carrier protein] ligase n=1 Tax=Microvirga flocculans TaxID=217168 RepID=A0A7W6IG63_9HYPH|nr:biotin--[acetyl-CoA-carboxylase] ligase [Microvirga flocculans]MBB4040872.1 BirA family biotin operon repressor/biotin-[acetyl-CoA-carboxylase] ligase [Microvirga flocculans]
MVHLSPETESAGYRLLSLEATGSTNDDALEAARSGDPGQLWVIATQQLAGRGRHGRQWSSPPGNLYASLLLIDPCELNLAPQLGFVAGLALHEAVESVIGVGAPRLALKWPNDLLLGGAKVAGLLLEGHRLRPEGPLAVVIGIGVNVAFAPTATPYPATTLQEVRPGLNRDDVFCALSSAFARTFSAWKSSLRTTTTDPFGAIRRLWLERAAGIGQEVTLRLPSGERKGIFEGLDRFGRLQLKGADGMELVDAGDLYFPNLLHDIAMPDAGTKRF